MIIMVANQILNLIEEKPRTAKQLCRKIGRSKRRVSRVLRILQDEGEIKSYRDITKDARTIVYASNLT